MGQAFDGFVVRIEAFELIQQPLLQGRDLTWLYTMFASECVDGVKTFFQILQAPRVSIKVI